MKNIFFLLLLFTGIAKAQIVNIPDANFKTKLIALGVDTNSDGNIQNSEALAVTTLNVSYSNISDLTGIEAFVNLTNLECASNQLTSLDVAPLINLTSLNCINNQISTFDVASLTNLTHLSCESNQLTALDVVPLTNLTYLGCSYNQLTALDVAPLINLVHLVCTSNLLTDLDVAPLTNLTYLDFQNNLLTSLNVNTLINLNTLYCGGSQFNTIDVSALTNLSDLSITETLQTSLDVSNLSNLISIQISNSHLTALDLSNCHQLATFNMSSNSDMTYLNIKNGSTAFLLGSMNSCPNLVYICADENENGITTVNQFLLSGSGNNPNVQVNSYCSFTPGGDYNTITGTARFDSNNNGCDISDPILNNIKIGINDGTNSGATFTNNLGNYTFFVQQPILTLTPSMENPTYFNISPATATLNFPTNNNSTQTQDFCITANGVHPDVEVVLIPLGQARPGFDADYQLVYKNKGNQTLSGAVNLTFNDAVTDFVSAMPTVDSQVPNSLTWNYANLLPFETRAINFMLNVNSPLETPAVNSGDILPFIATINPIAGDETPLDNVFDLHQTVVNSLDPNDKTCLEGNVISPQKIGEYLHYNINFENTGSADAVNVVVKDVIDTTKFDINTLQVMSASHDVRTEIKGNVVEFVFKNIHLASNPGGHGNVLFKIKTKSNLVTGDMVSNIANIFFDYNAPIITNEAKTTFATLSNPAFEIDNSVSVYPNPTKNNINISAKNNLKSVQLFDIQGRVLQTVLENKNATTIDVSNNANGVYFLKITTEDGCKIEKVVKE
jgi:uncharacterized repeat protein (TIGR01451 family)